jgi:pimeloyl-ACP methyl ester carboxylesterase
MGRADRHPHYPCRTALSSIRRFRLGSYRRQSVDRKKAYPMARNRSRRPLALLGVCLLAGARMAGAAASSPPEEYVAFCPARHTRDPAQYCPHVLEIGAPDPSRIIVLEPGADLGAESLEPAGRYLARALPGTQVWAVERREQDLMDLSHLGRPSEVHYYLRHEYLELTPQQTAAARTWGLPAAIADLRRIVGSAQSDPRRQVFLGGHSWGATIALAYAAWDFSGTAGYRGLSGIILIDGGVHDSFAGEGYEFHLTLADIRRQLRAIRSGSPFTGDLGYLWKVRGAPESVPIDYQLAASRAVSQPGSASALRTRLPAALQPPFPVTNAALFGWLIDTRAPVGDLQAHAGRLERMRGTLRGWQQTGPAALATIARVFAHRDPAAVEWYWPRRLTLDLEAVDPFVVSPVTRALGLRISHAAEIDVPLYAFETGLTHGTVDTAARWVVAHSRIRRAVYVTDDSMMHLDPLFDTPPRNVFLTTLVRFVREGSAGR